ncbi:AI-2E family transporter [Fulvivirga sedimenti]|uniref:AI-2E family transporter n=1 Tax=Fulvivirga sedimenti TaxID=2879465 RepID=A0A9X1HUL7_9BACT|nr:AI-2E family transporter [Fulvivirga sedimenti]MCA6077981.1 AI-2E family transporter [Fulvivirga sedimenti]
MKKREIMNSVSTTIEVGIRVLVFTFVIGWCLFLMRPFLTPILWGVILAVAVTPFYNWINHKISNRNILASIIVVFVLLAMLAGPTLLFSSSILHAMQKIGIHLSHGTLEIPDPHPSVLEWPFIGESFHDMWQSAHDNMNGFFIKYKSELSSAGLWFLNALKHIGLNILHILVAIIVAGILLATRGTQETAELFYIKLIGRRGPELRILTEQTIRQVAKGILGVAFIEATYFGLIFLFAGVPHAGIWALLCLILVIIQIGSLPVLIPVVIYMFSTLEPSLAILYLALLIFGIIIDHILKPILLGKGASVPMLVIFMGAIGGLLLSGFIGLFTGAIVLSLGYKLFVAWLYDEPATDAEITEEDYQPIP